jgi:hypothetical protein
MWEFWKPGITVQPRQSSTQASGGTTTESAGPIATMRPSRSRTVVLGVGPSVAER